MTRIFFIIIFISILNNVFGQRAEFVNLLLSSKDTLTIYERHSNCDSVILYKFQIYKGTSEYVIKTFRPLAFKLPKKCYDLVEHKPDKLSFKFFQTCSHPTESLSAVEEIELAIRSIKKDTASCYNRIKYSIIIGSENYSNKQKSCGQEISIKIHNYFGCAVVDQDTKSIE